jgi:hypothetical protein
MDSQFAKLQLHEGYIGINLGCGAHIDDRFLDMRQSFIDKAEPAVITL